MSGLTLFSLWMLLLLGSSNEVVKAKANNARVIKAGFRRDDYCRMESINVTQLGGVILSPRFPKPYPRNLMLSWKLLSPPGTRIHLEFKNFSLEGPVKGVCSNDFVQMECPMKASSVRFDRWCGRDPPHCAPHTINSTGNSIRIAFKSNDMIVGNGFKIQYSLLYDSPATKSIFDDPMLMSDFGTGQMLAPVTEVPFSLEDLDRVIASFDTIEELFKSFNPNTWKQDLESIYTETQILYRSRAYHLASRENKVDLNRLYDDVKRYSCTPRNFSVNIREELRITSAVFFPRCLLVKRCGGNCGCGTDNWNTGCSCQPSKTTQKLHEVLKYAPDMSSRRHHRSKVRWVMGEIFLTHHEKCECSCPNQPPR